MRGEYYTFAARRVFTGKNPPGGGDFLHAKSLPHGVFLPVNSLRGTLFRGGGDFVPGHRPLRFAAVVSSFFFLPPNPRVRSVDRY